MPGYIKIIIATLLFASGPIFVKTIDLDGISILWGASVIGAIVLSLNLLVRGKIKEFLTLKKADAPILLALGAVTTINNSLFNLSIKSTTVANAILTHYLAPLFLILFGFFLFHEKIERRSLVALSLTIGGLLIIISPQELSFDNTHFVGILLGLGSAIFFASEIVAKKRLSFGYRADLIALWFFIITIISLLPFISFKGLGALSIMDAVMLVIYALLLFVIGIIIFISGTRDTKAQHIGILSYLEPLGAIVLGSVILLEFPSIYVIFGGALILLGGYLIVSRKIREARNTH